METGIFIFKAFCILLCVLITAVACFLHILDSKDEDLKKWLILELVFSAMLTISFVVYFPQVIAENGMIFWTIPRSEYLILIFQYFLNAVISSLRAYHYNKDAICNGPGITLLSISFGFNILVQSAAGASTIFFIVWTGPDRQQYDDITTMAMEKLHLLVFSVSSSISIFEFSVASISVWFASVPMETNMYGTSKKCSFSILWTISAQVCLIVSLPISFALLASWTFYLHGKVNFTIPLVTLMVMRNLFLNVLSLHGLKAAQKIVLFVKGCLKRIRGEVQNTTSTQEQKPEQA